MIVSTGTRNYLVAPDSDCGYMIREIEPNNPNRYLSAAHALVRDERGLVRVGRRVSPKGEMFGPEIAHIPADILGTIRNEIKNRDHLDWLEQV